MNSLRLISGLIDKTPTLSLMSASQRLTMGIPLEYPVVLLLMVVLTVTPKYLILFP